jgi:hypothetical protein
MSTQEAEKVSPLEETTIEKFIERHSSKDAAGAKQSADRAAGLGFGKSANVRWSRFLETFHDNPRQAAYYKEKYPLCSFLPWSAFHEIRRVLDLWCDLSDHYIGAVPDEALMRLELIDIDQDDCVEFFKEYGPRGDLMDLMGEEWSERVLNALTAQSRRVDFSNPATEFRRTAAQYAVEASSKFFVLAPKEAFSTQEDWISRFRQLTNLLAEVEKTPPNDPLVIRFVKGGVLVVAAWGDEAAELNAQAREIDGQRHEQ